jgi:predicted nucleic acid-binding protein
VIAVDTQESWAIPVFCLGEFVRVVTHPRVFDPPTPLQTALEALDRLLASPTCHLLNPGSRYSALFRHSALEADTRGNLAFDAQIVAVCKEHEITRLLSLDRDFSRFTGLTLLSPADPPPASEPLPEESEEQKEP